VALFSEVVEQLSSLKHNTLNPSFQWIHFTVT